MPNPTKKRKITHDRELTHSEIWDDTALLASWNEALEEYRYYHSLAARGEKIERVLEEEEGVKGDDVGRERDEGESEGDDVGERDVGVEEGEFEEGEYEREDNLVGVRAASDDESYDDAHAAGGHVPSTARDADDQGQAPFIGPTKPAASAAGNAAPAAASMPQALLGSVGGQDEAMKNLMMSWYYAGYYTGYFEGQRQSGHGGEQEAGRGAEGEATVNGMQGKRTGD